MSHLQLNRKIFAVCRELGIDSDMRHDIQHAVIGKASLSDMSYEEKTRLLGRLVGKGGISKRQSAGRNYYKAAPRPDLRLIHKLWGLLGKAGALENPTREGLNRFISRRFGKSWGNVPIDIDNMRDSKEINDVIRALKDWCARENIELKK